MNVPLLASALALGLLTSACVSSEGSSAKSASSAVSAAPPSHSDEGGSVLLRLIDDELKPVAGVEAALQGDTSYTSKTDAEGKATFNDVIPGNYNLIVQKLGYESTARKITVLVGETIEVEIEMEPIALDVARTENWIDDGYIRAAVWTWGLGLNPTLSDDKRSFEHPVDTKLQSVVSALAWDSSTALTARYLFLRDSLDGTAVNTTQGKSPIVNRGDELDREKKGKLTVSFGLAFVCPTLGTHCVTPWTSDPTSIVIVAYEQRVKIYTNAFYGEGASADFTGLPA